MEEGSGNVEFVAIAAPSLFSMWFGSARYAIVEIDHATGASRVVRVWSGSRKKSMR
jgi:hypothetical protein